LSGYELPAISKQRNVVENLKYNYKMIDDLKKYLKEIIYERTTSPLYGTLITSWLIWNWRIIYISFFVSESKIKGNKIDYIITNYSDTEHIVIYPLISTFLLLTIIPFLSNGAYWFSLNFNKWKIDQKNIVDKKQLLSLEQSITLREEIARQEERFGKLIENKNLEISQLQTQLNEYREKIPNVTLENLLNSEKIIDDSEIHKLSERIKTNPKELTQYEMILLLVQGGQYLTDRNDIDSKFIALMESYDLIENRGNGKYNLTAQGKRFQKLMLE
jgi:hypothetical protein